MAVAGLPILASPTAHAASAGLVISEVYGGGGNSGSTWKNDFIELYNPTDRPISVDGWSVQARAATNTAAATAANTVNLSGAVPAGGYYLIQHAAGTGGIRNLPTADAVGEAAMGAAGWQVWLSNGTTLLDPPDGDVTATAVANPAIVDFVGGAANATSYETARVTSASSNTLSIHRNGADTDNNAANFTTAAPTPTNADGETEPPVGVNDPGDKSFELNQAVTPFTVTASNGTAPYTFSATGLPSGLSMTSAGVVSGTPTEEGISTVTVKGTDSSSPARTGTATFTVTVSDTVTVRPIAAIQGTGERSPLAGAGQNAGRSATTEGVVTALLPDPHRSTRLGTAGGFDGLFIQTGGTGGATDATPGASDGIFVYFANNVPAGVALGDSVRVTGPVSEFSGSTQISATVAGSISELAQPLPPVTPLAAAYPRTAEEREAHEGELVAPDHRFTVTNSYSLNTFGEIGLAAGSKTLMQPTELYRASDTANIQSVKDDNYARGVILDDGVNVNYMTNDAAKDIALPWLTRTRSIRVGARAMLKAPVILDYRFGTWRFQPTSPVTSAGSGVATFDDTRRANATPATVPGDVKIATFNVLNYFNTTGQQFVANGKNLTPPASCSYYDDRDGNPIANNTCTPNGPRGAASDASLARQEAKLVTAINRLGADVVGLQEIENSIKLVGETNRDDALAQLVAKLNAAAGAGTWDFVHSPAEATTSTNVGFQDVIRPAFIFKPAKVRPVGQSDIYFEQSAIGRAFANAREPLAQAFKRVGALDKDAFAVVLNHFKSKGDSDPPATGDNANGEQGAFNGDRVRQATKLVEFANGFAAARGIEEVFLAGDFNSYSQEDPMHVLYEAGYEAIESAQQEESYSFSGLSGSLDHVLANKAAHALVTKADIWDINASESVAYQYSRYNYNATDFFNGSDPFAASDHNPEIVGLDLPDVTGGFTEVQLIGTNDFHGRLLADGTNAAGAAVLAGAVKELESERPNTVFAAAGDLVGASTFESFIQDDDPTIEALNEAGLDVSAAGNHEFDQGYEDLVGDITDAANWEYIGANVIEPAGRDDLAETWTATFGEVEIGFVGAVTEDLPSLVSPSGIEGVTVTDIVEATNAAAAELRADGADAVVLLVHEGSPSSTCSSSSFTDPGTVWGNITQNTSADVDAIVSGHTHLAYNCEFTVDEWVAEGRAVTKRPVVSAGQYGTFLNQLVFTFDDATGEVIAKSQEVIGLLGTGYAPDPTVAETVAAARAQADVLGARPLGHIKGAFNRAKLANGTTENRGGESTLGNLVAEVQRWATSVPEAGSAQIAFMNPGGLREDMVGGVTGETAYPKTLTYKQAAVVQPFANTLVNMDLTGADIKLALEQQWQRDASGAVPSRPFLRLGTSEGFTYTFDATRPEGERIIGMWLDGTPVAPTATYSVTVNSFLASGGDNFRAFNNGTNKADTGKVDLEAMVDYMAEFASKADGDPALPVDYSQRAVGVAFPAGAPASYAPGDHVRFDVSSWTMSTAADVKDQTVDVYLGDRLLGSATLDNTIGTAVFDDYGKAAVDVVLPDGVPAGAQALTLKGAETGTVVTVRIAVAAAG